MSIVLNNLCGWINAEVDVIATLRCNTVVTWISTAGSASLLYTASTKIVFLKDEFNP